MPVAPSPLRLVAVVLLTLALTVHGDPAAAALPHRWPVDGPVVRGFDLADGPYGPGHRGVDLAVPPGTTVRATAEGVVAFAGTVAGVAWVAIEHPDGVRTSYGPLAGVRVVAGEVVAAGAPLGVLAEGGHGGDGDVGLHLGARRDGTYIDPRTLPGLRPARPTLVGPGGWWASDPAVEPYAPWGGGRLGGIGVRPSPVATAPGYAVAPNPNHVVVIGGLASSSASPPLDLTHLGFAARSITHLSYAGRTDVDPEDGAARPGALDATDPRRDQLPYGPASTWAGVDAAARRLRDQLRAQAAREPGRAVDLVGHSMGGVVAMHYLTAYHDAYDRSLPPIAHVVTVASPLSGSDLAHLADALADHRSLGPGLEALRVRLATGDGRVASSAAALPLDAAAIGQLASGSDFVAALADAWDAALTADGAGPLAMGTRVLTVPGATDRVVGADRASVPLVRPVGTYVPSVLGDVRGPVLERRVLPGGHTAVLTTEAVREITWRFLADREVVASPGVGATMVAAGHGSTLRLVATGLDLSDLLLGP